MSGDGLDEGRHKKEAGPRAADTGTSSNGYSAALTSKGQVPTAQFGRVPYAVIDVGGIVGLSKVDTKTYLALCAHADEHWRASPGVLRLAELTGAHQSTVRTATRRLEARGLICVQKMGGRSKRNVYTIATNPRGIGRPFTEKNSRGIPRLFSPRNARDSIEKQWHPVAETLADSSRNPRGMTRPEQREQSLNRVEQTGAALGASERELLAALHRHGIESPTNGQLIAAHPGVTPALIEEALGVLDSKVGPGLRVIVLRRQLPALLEREACKNRLAAVVTDLTSDYGKNQAAVRAWHLSQEVWQLDDFKGPAKKTLAERLGGTDAARAVVDNWSKRLRTAEDRRAWDYLLWRAAGQDFTGPCHSS